MLPSLSLARNDRSACSRGKSLGLRRMVVLCDRADDVAKASWSLILLLPGNAAKAPGRHRALETACLGQQLRTVFRLAWLRRGAKQDSPSFLQNVLQGRPSTPGRRAAARPTSSFPFCSLPSEWAPCTIQRTSGLPRPRGDYRDEYQAPHTSVRAISGTIRGTTSNPCRRRLRDGGRQPTGGRMPSMAESADHPSPRGAHH
jgi:hypothetical protein